MSDDDDGPPVGLADMVSDIGKFVMHRCDNDFGNAFQATVNVLVSLARRSESAQVVPMIVVPVVRVLMMERPDWAAELLPLMKALEPFDIAEVRYATSDIERGSGAVN